MLKKRNAQGLSITTIIVAVIGLIVVVVLIAIFTGRIGSFGKGLDMTEKNIIQSCSSLCGVQGFIKASGTIADSAACKTANPNAFKVISVTLLM